MTSTLAVLLAVALLGCSQPPAPEAVAPEASAAAAPAPAAAGADASASAEAALPLVVVHKDPYCGCCNAWIEHMRHAGFPVEARNEADMGPVKASAGVPPGKGSCHTAIVDGYLIEGHVPAADVKRLLAERPDARGLVLPGMPMGSPGMETPDGRTQPYTVELVANDGSTTPYARH
ncbi:DUF411 domain-containing protein [Cognatiluteimonas lumbrici]|uniref:DUF411 domain-containing protein n=1 Tax=Cognatiluteimonas lumbrici TaxID=2559601 RepID=UPI00387EBACF